MRRPVRSLFRRWLARTDRFWDALLFRRTPAPLNLKARLAPVQPLEERVVPDARPLPYPVIATGADTGGSPVAKLFDADTGAVLQTFTPFDPAFTGGVRVALADFSGDGYPDLALAAGPGGGPEVRILDGKTGEQVPGPLGSFFAYDPSFTGGVQVAAGDVNLDGVPDLLTAADAGGGPHVNVFDGKTGKQLQSFFAFEPEFTGGVRLAVGDLNGDLKGDLILAAGAGGAPRVRVLDAATLQPIAGPLGDFFAFDPADRGGVFVAAGDANADDRTDLVVGAGVGHSPEVRAFDGKTGAVALDAQAFDAGYVGGVRVGTAYVDDDSYADVVAGTGPGTAPRVVTLSGKTGLPVAGWAGDFDPGVGSALGGVTIAADNDPFAAIPHVTPSAERVAPGEPFSVRFTVTSATAMDYWSGTLDWGDGNTQSITVNASGGPSTSLSADFTHVYASPGTADVLDNVSVTGTAFVNGPPSSHSSTSSGLVELFVAGTAGLPPDQAAPAGGPLGGAPANGTGNAGWAGTVGGVRAGDGVYSVDDPGVSSGGFGTDWGQDQSWSNAAAYAAGSASGVGRAGGRLPHLVKVGSSLAAIFGAGSASYYDGQGTADANGNYSSYLPRHAGQGSIAYTSTGDKFTLDDGTGRLLTYLGFGTSASPAAGGQAGSLDSVTAPGGDVTSVYSRDDLGRPTDVRRSATAGGTTTTESYLYEYLGDTDANAGLLSRVTLRRQVGTGSWTTVRKVEYAYYGASDSNGNLGDLQRSKVEDASGNVLDQRYYRYYTGDTYSGLTYIGYQHGLKYALGPEAYDQLKAAAGGTDAGVDSASDSTVAGYADTYLEFDASYRVTKLTAAGRGTFTYAYMTSSNSAGTNSWATKTVETLPDSNTNTYYVNAYGEPMLKAYTDTAASQTWLWYTEYDSAGRVVLAAQPSAVTGYSDSYADLVHFVSGNAQYLSDSSGLVETDTYYSSTTATDTTAGGAAGFEQAHSIRHGETGADVPQESWTYFRKTAGGATATPVAADTKYRNDDGTGGEATSYAYTWQTGTTQPASVVTTLPTVTTAENGPNSAASSTVVYDAYGRPVWQKDRGGYLTYLEYDTATGAVTKKIVDVDTTQTSDFSNLPSGWSTPSGGGLHLKTVYEVDALGRTTKETDPAGKVTYVVFLDTDYEVRTYPGWDATNNVPTGPTQVTREDRPGRYTEQLTMSATPAVSGGRPTGDESIGGIQSLSRAYRNDAGQTVYTDAYFDLTGLTYTTSTTFGTSGTNFYRTTLGYDGRGRQDRTVSPAGTVTREVFDGLGRPVSQWVGTDDTPTSGAWSPSNTAGTDLFEVRDDQYDGGGVGDGNQTKVTEHPGLSAADRVTQRYFDWRDRQIEVKQGVQATESTSVNRPITYTQLDNLGEAVSTEVYDGDAVTVTTTSGVPDRPSSSLLRAKTVTSFDEQGRAYRTQQYSVDPSSGSVSTSALTADTWFDSRGNAIKVAAPGGEVTKTAFDGAGRATTAYTTDGGGDSGYVDASTVTGDAVLQQVETQYDADGNPILTTTRERFHDETGTGALGTPTSGVHARVSYQASYYDLANRLTASVDVGTNGGSAYTRPSSVPSRSDTFLVTSNAYAADAVQEVRLTGSPTGGTFTLSVGGQTTAGIAYNASASTVQSALAALSTVGTGNVSVTPAAGSGWRVRFAGTLAGAYEARMGSSGSGLTGGTSPSVAVTTVSAGGDAGAVAATTDPAGLVGRTYRDGLGRTTQAVEDYTGSAVSASSDKTTDYGYGPAGMTSLTAELAGGAVQTTAWVYGVTASGGSAITSNDVVGATQWPDPTTGAASSSQQDTVTVNALGQTATSTDRNGTVHALTYDVLGRVTADAATTLGTGVDGAVRRIETAYDALGNPSLVTSYDAASAGSVVNQVELDRNGLGQLTADWQEHSGSVTGSTPKVQYAYTVMSGGANHSRLTTVTYPNGKVLTDNYASGLSDSISRLSSLSDTSGTLESYDYLGLGTVVRRAHGQPGVDLTYIMQTGESTGDAGDQYTGLDRFGRVVDQRWINTSSGTATDRFQYGYDRDSNRTYRDNLVNSSFGEVYSYDGLNQLSGFQRGTLNAGKTGISGTASRSQSWSPDEVGNFASVTTDGTAQSRTANKQNEVTSVGSLTTPTYDADGNMTGDETGRQFVYDAWNRVVRVKNSGGTTLETLAYDGLNRRVSQTASGTTTDLYYSSAWQVLEERVGGTTKAQYVWSPVYVDAPVLRDRDADGNSSNGLEERLWVQQDANWNVTGLVNGSGSVVERYAYDPFGAVAVYNSSYSMLSGSGYAWTVLFQGLRSDTTAGVYHVRARALSPTLGRPLQRDPVGFSGGDENLYRWEQNAPVGSTDPLGLAPIPSQPGGIVPIGSGIVPYPGVVGGANPFQPGATVVVFPGGGTVTIVSPPFPGLGGTITFQYPGGGRTVIYLSPPHIVPIGPPPETIQPPRPTGADPNMPIKPPAPIPPDQIPPLPGDPGTPKPPNKKGGG